MMSILENKFDVVVKKIELIFMQDKDKYLLLACNKCEVEKAVLMKITQDLLD